MNKTDRISIAVPAYNVEKYIKKCIESLLGQTYQDIEILLVLNGSTDNTEIIAKQMAGDDERVKVFQIDQSGVSSARNIAIEHCTGKYMMFLDSDDYYDMTMVEKMYRCIKENPVEMAVCNYFDVYDENKTDENPQMTEWGIHQITDYMKGYAKDFHTLYYGVLWNKIYIADIIRDKIIRFNSEICLGEDSLFNLQYLRNVNNIYILNESMYFHNRHNVNSLTNILSSYDMWMMSVERYQYCIETFEYFDLINECKADLSFRIISDLMFPVDDIIADRTMSLKEKKQKFENILNNEVVPFAYHNADKLSLSQKIIKLFKRNRGMIVLLLSMKRKLQK